MTEPGNGSPTDDPFAHLYRPEPASGSSGDQAGQHAPQLPPSDARNRTYPSYHDHVQFDATQTYPAQAAAADTQWVTDTRPVSPEAGAPTAVTASPMAAPRRGPGVGLAVTALVVALVAVLGGWVLLHGNGKGAAKADAATTTPPSASSRPTSSASPVGADKPLRTTADKLQLAGGATLSTDHSGYSGSGFVSGLDKQGSSATWLVDVPKAGSYRLTVRYSNALAGDGKQIERKIGLTVNGAASGQLRMPVIGSWDSWGTTWRFIRLKSGANQIAIVCNPGDSCYVNVDKLTLTKRS